MLLLPDGKVSLRNCPLALSRGSTSLPALFVKVKQVLAAVDQAMAVSVGK